MGVCICGLPAASPTKGAVGACRGKAFAIGLGCDVQHAQRLVYSKGLDLLRLTATPIGMGCKWAYRLSAAQAFPFTGKPLRVNTDESSFVPYGVGQ